MAVDLIQISGRTKTAEGESLSKTPYVIIGKEVDIQGKQTLKVETEKRGLKKLSTKPETDQDRKKQANKEKFERDKKSGKLDGQVDGKKPNK